MPTLVSVTSVPAYSSPEDHLEIVGSTPTSFSDILPILRHKEENVSVRLEPPLEVFAEQDVNRGTLYVIESLLVFMSATGSGFQIEYPSITLHAISRSEPKPSIYCQLDESTENAPENDSEDVIDVRELFITPQEESSLESIFEALSLCAALHPDKTTSEDPGDSLDNAITNGDLENFIGNEEQELSEVGRAAQAHLESIISYPNGSFDEYSEHFEDEDEASFTFTMQDLSTALFQHILSQTRQNVQFLREHDQISQQDADNILDKLVLKSAGIANEEVNFPTLPSVPSIPVPSFQRQPSVDITQRLPPPPPSAPKRYKALWDYNLNNEDVNDLQFHAGDVIELVTKTNDDWWTGKIYGRQGIFPSSYVEEVPLSANAVSHFPPPPVPGPGPPYEYAEKPHMGYSHPPPPTHYSQPAMIYPAPPTMGPPPQAPVVTEAAQPPKKNRFGGKLGNTLAHSAVGGVGFGAGSAIGNGIIHSIF